MTPSFRSRSFAHRLVSSLAMMVLPLVVLAMLQLALGRHSADRSAATAQEIVAESTQLATARNEIRELEADAVRVYLGEEGARLRLTEQRQRAVAALDAVRLDMAPARRLVASARTNLLDGFAQLQALRGAGAADATQLTSFHAQIYDADMMLGRAERMAIEEVQHDAAAGAREHRHATLAIVGLILLTALIAALLGRRLGRDLRRGLRPLRDAARRVGAGDLDHRIDSRRDDELGELAAAFDAMAESTLTAHRELVHQARHDALTGLPNRSVLVDRIEHAAARAVRDRPDLHLGVVLIGLDGFKALNDTVGHSAGDALLRTVAKRLTAELRPGDTVARLGGDEFAVLLEELYDAAEAVLVAERLVAALDQPLQFEGRELRVTASAGLCAVRATDADPDVMLRDADVAMARAKSEGAGRHRVFEGWMQTDVAERVRRIGELRTAIAEGQLELRHQPIVRIEDGELASIEALVRWQHPERGLIPPNDFIPLAEETGLVVELGAWVLERAVADLCVLNAARGRDEAPLSVSVNVSPRQLQDPGFHGLVRTAVQRLDGRGELLMLEVTEHAFVGDADEAREVLERLRALGVRVAIDDFGTGWSSLAYLSRLPVDVLKIDRSFLAPDGEPALVEAIVGLAHTLGLKTVAEGIEEHAQLELLRGLGCTFGQGYLFSRPVPLDALLPPLAAAA